VRVVVVSSYPPRHCGVGTYAAGQVADLRVAGHDVWVISPPDGQGDERVRAFGGRPFLRAVRRARRADRVVVHFQPGLWYRPRRPVSKVLTSLGLLWLTMRRPATELVVHEANRPRWGGLRPDDLLLGLALRRARLLFHTDTERRQLEREFHLRVRRHALVEHAVHLGGREPVPRSEARAALAIPEHVRLFVCPGFLHPDKGFERAVEAFGRPSSWPAPPLGDPEPSDRRLVVVGSVRDRTMENLAYVGRLRDLCERTSGVTFLDTYLDEEDFDRWIAAADRLVLPYRRSWSSGVLARARAIGTAVIVAATGGLPEQAGPEDRVFETDEELARLLHDAVGDRAGAAP
jgi:glycosyltransferase involved in cell wall biosynthesis